MAAAAPPPNYSPFTLEPQLNTRKIPSKSDSNALCKTLIIVLLVLAIPLFPSQAPDFISQTVFTDCWEIIHLFFIGIAVSYGVFGRRTAQLVPQKSADPSTGDDSLSYLSGISHLTSIFDHGYENACYENDILHNYVNCSDQLVRNDECVVPSAAKIRSFVPNDENEGNGNLAWRSLYTKAESLVVVSNAKCFNGGTSETEFKPLNLPIRSLWSRAADNESDKQEFKKVDEFSSKKYEALGNDKDGDDARTAVKIKGVVPVNLDKKLGEVIGRSTIPWRSRSGSMENEEEISGSISKLPAHSCRPHSAGEFEFEHLKSRPLRGKKFSSNPELRSSSERVFSASPSKADSIDSDPFSNSTSSDMDSVGDLGNNLESSGVEEEVRKGKQSIESFDGDAKSSTLSKVPARAKSVRTIKPKRYVVNQKEQYPSRGESKFGSRFVKTEAADSLIKRREEKPEIPPVDHQNQESGRIFSVPKPKPSISKLHGEEKQGIDDLSSTTSVDREIGFDKSLVEDETIPNIDTDGELGSEVDRKADEFIAKFRKQIRCQKASTSSVEGYSGW
ncbi:hypothetical protein SASPL_109131 [Salvia splendens]|uniref:Uncharacterized protein n=1 Tax=Salvia splendens TaxID=180675 RepID=A0A8X8YJH8_SALSN|nr:uncharacterized protein LOC121796949 [Salvia splendens]KAG6431056.1 hypothetical protein SASPL_109131 [Salvia splendens]